MSSGIGNKGNSELEIELNVCYTQCNGPITQWKMFGNKCMFLLREHFLDNEPINNMILLEILKW